MNKFIILCLLGATSTSAAKLVYFDSEQKHRAKNPPKREIVLEKCFNINRKQDSQVPLPFFIKKELAYPQICTVGLLCGIQVLNFFFFRSTFTVLMAMLRLFIVMLEIRSAENVNCS